MKKISVITVNYNQPKVTLEFLRSVQKYTMHKNFEIIVIDNGSMIDSTIELATEFPDVNYIRSEKNLGFAGGNNLGILKASGDYLFFVNNDTEFTEDVIGKLAKIMDSAPAIGMISPKIKYFEQPDLIQYAGFSAMNYNTGRNKCIGQFEKDTGQYDHTTGSTSYIHGAAMMVRREAIEKAGLMPENFFLYYEEMDWCEKIKQCDYQIWIEPKAVIYHKESASVGLKSPLKEYFMNRNRILFIRRNAPLLSRIAFYFHFFMLVSPRNLFSYLSEKRPDLAKQFFKAIWWNITHKKDSNEDFISKQQSAH
ncbi:MAG: glycosyltransferase family 2 protein [Daejeonella sp.]